MNPRRTSVQPFYVAFQLSIGLQQSSHLKDWLIILLQTTSQNADIAPIGSPFYDMAVSILESF